MAITTFGGVVAGLQPQFPVSKTTLGGTIATGNLRNSWYISGFPQAASGNSAGLAGSALTSPVAGQVPFNDPPTGNAYLCNADVSPAAINNPIILIDRLWHNSGFTITSTSAQTVNSVTWPARDINGATNGEGVYIALEISATVGAAAPTLTLSYTNSAGTSGRTATSIIATVNSSTNGNFYTFALQNGDTGVRSVQSLTLSASWLSGTIHLVAFRPIALLQSDNKLGMSSVEDAFTLAMPRLYNGTVLQILSAAASSGQIGYTFG